MKTIVILQFYLPSTAVFCDAQAKQRKRNRRGLSHQPLLCGAPLTFCGCGFSTFTQINGWFGNSNDDINDGLL